MGAELPQDDREAARPRIPETSVKSRIGYSVLLMVGALIGVFSPAFSIGLMVFAAWRLAKVEVAPPVHVAGLGLLVGLVLSILDWTNYGSLVMPCIIIALVTTYWLPGHVSITRVSLLIGALGVLMVASDYSIVAPYGYGLGDYVDALLDEIRPMLAAQVGGGTDASVEALVESSIALVGMLWPLLYASRAMVAVMAGLLGLCIARKDSYRSVYAAYLRFDLPLWVVVALIAGIVCTASRMFGLPYAGFLQQVGINILVICKVLFFLQGFAVVLGVLERRSWGFAPRVAVITMALIAEMLLFAVCLLGVVDIWADFRGVRREAARTLPGSSGTVQK